MLYLKGIKYQKNHGIISKGVEKANNNTFNLGPFVNLSCVGLYIHIVAEM